MPFFFFNRIQTFKLPVKKNIYLTIRRTTSSFVKDFFILTDKFAYIKRDCAGLEELHLFATLNFLTESKMEVVWQPRHA